jgi:hypothetical protein
MSIATVGDGCVGVASAIEPEERIDLEFTRKGDTA